MIPSGSCGILIGALWIGAWTQVISALPVLLCPTFTLEGPRTLPSAVRVYADEKFYKTRPEPEESIKGVVETNWQVLGPATRPLPFKLRGQKGEWFIYAVGSPEELLRAFLEKEVEVCAKKVDLSQEGFDLELWIGAIRKVRQDAQNSGE